MILPRANLSRAEALAERIRESVKEKELKKRSTGETLGFVTISVGVATYHPGDTVVSLIDRAAYLPARQIGAEVLDEPYLGKTDEGPAADRAFRKTGRI
ncbi:MAG: diguanylate cyclase, partial [Lactococcus sp.]|nr:diguanylate cyclase [Lactococcus sp.]